MSDAARRPEAPAQADLAAEDQAASKVLMALMRLAQQSTLYDANNQAQQAALQSAAAAAEAYGQLTGRNITIFFSERAVYVGRRLLRASRNVYAAANHVRKLLAAMGATQITIGYDVPLDDLRALQDAFAQATQNRQVDAPSDLTRIRLRVGRPPGDFAEFDGLSPEERAIKVYALAIVIVRRFYERLQSGQWEITAHVRRISEELITLSERATPALLTATVARPSHDDAERAVSAALLSLCMARQLTGDQRLLRWLATGALVCDVGKPRVAGLNPHGEQRVGLRMPALGLDQYRELPGATAFVTTALGRLTDAGMMRSVLVYEALHIEHREETGTAYGGERAPVMLSRLLACARRFQSGLSEGAAAPDVIAALLGKCSDETDKRVLQLLMGTLNIMPTGTIVELADGRWARVVSPPVDRIDFGRPLVRVVPRPNENIKSHYLDLNEPLPDGSLPPQPVRIIAAVDEQQELNRLQPETAPPSSDDEAIDVRFDSSSAPPHSSTPAREPITSAPPRRFDARAEATTAPPRAMDARAEATTAPPRAKLDSAEAVTVPPRAMPPSSRPRRQSSTELQMFQVEPPEPRRKQHSSPEMRAFATDRDDELRIMIGRQDDPDSVLASVPPPPLSLSPHANRPASDAPHDSDRPPRDEDGEVAAPTTRPMAQGTFAKTPLVHLLVYALDNKLTGTLLTDQGGRRSAIYFENGLPCKAQTATLVSPLDRTLLDMGLLDAETLAQTLHAVARTRHLHGRYLVSQGLLTQAQLDAALRQQLVNKIGSIMRLDPSTRYGYFNAVDLMSHYGGNAPVPCQPLPLIMMGVRKYIGYDVLDTVLPRVANTHIALHPLAKPEKLGLKPAEEMVIHLVRSGPITLNEMLADTDVDQDAAQRVVYALVITRFFDLSGGARKPVGL